METALPALLRAADVAGDYELFPLAGGANNRVYRVETDAGALLLKRYFQHPADQRDRLHAEFRFATFAWDCGVRVVPRPLACSREHGLGLFEFVEGRRVQAGQVTSDLVAQAMAFYIALNQHRGSAAGLELPVASEAWWTIDDHVACVERRLGRLRRMTAVYPVEREAVSFVRHELTAAWTEVRRRVDAALRAQGRCGAAPLLPRDRCLSPSDFGFHNALIEADGRLRFLDFEYAGWDDPARLVCDFFCQPQVPVPRQHRDLVSDVAATAIRDETGYRQRLALLGPIYEMKWCCIVLNEFLSDGGERRRFAAAAGAVANRKATQLDRARRLLAHRSSDTWTAEQPAAM
jgi:hypothetical protein